MEKLNFLTFWLHSIQILSWNPVSLWRYNLHYYLVWVDFLLFFLPSLITITSFVRKDDKKFQRHSRSNTAFYIVEKDDQIHVEKSELPRAGNFFEALMYRSAYTWIKNYLALEKRLPLLQMSSSQQFKLWSWFFSSPKEVAFCILKLKVMNSVLREVIWRSLVSIVPSHLSH